MLIALGDTSFSLQRQDPSLISTASLVASWDQQCTSFTAVSSAQAATEQLIRSFMPMAEELLERYRKRNNGHLPQRILYYRDAVSESQLDAIKMHEGLALRELCEASGTKITIILSIKRHHSRFFADPPYATKRKWSILKHMDCSLLKA